MVKRKRRKEENTDRSMTPGFRTVLGFSLIALFVLIAAASFLPGRRLWGINHLAFLPVSIRITALLAIAASFVPWIARVIHGALHGALDRMSADTKRIILCAVIAAIVSTVVFARFRSSTLLLGDGHLVVRNYEYAAEGYDNVVTRDLSTILREEEIARGTSVLYFLSARIAQRFFGGSPTDGIRIFNALLGGIFMLILLRVALGSDLGNEVRLWMIFLVLTSGTMELFFGYVENYPPLIFLSLCYVAFGLAAIRRRSPLRLFTGFVILLLCIAAHIQAVLLVPSFVLLLGLYAARGREATVLRYLTPAVAVLTVAGAIFVWAFTPLARHILPLRSDGGVNGILSASHWLDVLNELLILLPALFVIIAMAVAILVMRWRDRRAGRSDARSGRPDSRTRRSNARTGRAPGSHGTGDASKSRGIGSTAAWHYTCILLLPTVIYLVLFRAEIGMARDWDLFTIVFVGLLPLALLVLESFLDMMQVRFQPLVTVPAFVMSIVLGISWVGVNADASRSERRFERILTYDRTNEAYVYEILAKHYEREGYPERAIGAVERAVEISRNPRQLVILGRLYMENGRPNDAIDVFYRILERGPEYRHAGWARRNLVTLLDERKRFNELMTVAREGTQLHPDEPIYHYFYGKMLLGMGRFREGADELLECRRLEPPPDILRQIETVLEHLRAEKKI